MNSEIIEPDPGTEGVPSLEGLRRALEIPQLTDSSLSPFQAHAVASPRRSDVIAGHQYTPHRCTDWETEVSAGQLRLTGTAPPT